jgi:hypothetical protein
MTRSAACFAGHLAGKCRFDPRIDPLCGMFCGSFGSKTALYTTTQPTLINPQIFVIILVFILNKGEKI